MGYLITAAVATLLGPVLYRILHGHPKLVRLVDGSVYVAVPLLVMWQVLPDAWVSRSVLALVALAAGFVVPAIVEKASHALAKQTDNLAMVIGLSGLVLHAMLEGAAFAPGDGAVDGPFAVAVILHRIPVSLVIWWLIFPRFGSSLAATGVGSIVLATLAGYGIGSEVLGGMHTGSAAVYQAFVSGSLVHVVFHQGRQDHDHTRENEPTQNYQHEQDSHD